MDISQFFIKGDIKGAIAYMKQHEEYQDFLKAYTDLFENENYLKYDIPEILDNILLQYQIYYHDIFYRALPLKKAEDRLSANLKTVADINDNEIESAKKLKDIFEKHGYHALFGKTQGYYGPYIWKDTVSENYEVELIDTKAIYRVNILKNFIFRSWMDYLTFGRFGTGGWADEDGTINCIEKAYDFNSERFLISLLKHEAQHTVDMQMFKGISEAELEYRAKLIELYYSNDPYLLYKFISEADATKVNDGHAVSSSWIKEEFMNTDKNNPEAIKNRAFVLFKESSDKMHQKYDNQAD